MAPYFPEFEPLPPEVKRTATILRIQPVVYDGTGCSMRYHGLLRLDGRNMLFSRDSEDGVDDLALAQPGDQVEIGATTFDGDTVYPRSLRLLWKEDEPGFDKLTGDWTADATVLRKALILRRPYGRGRQSVRVAVHLHRTISGVATFSSDDQTALFVAEPGDRLSVEFGITTYAPRRFYPKEVHLVRVCEERRVGVNAC